MADDRKHNPYCLSCIYYAPSTMSCDYVFMEDHSRPCPAGAGCTARILKKDVKKKMGKPRWDIALGKQMWEQGMSDTQIAKHFGIAANTVLHQRRSYWEKGIAAPVKKKKEEAEVKRPLKDEVLEKTEPCTSPEDIAPTVCTAEEPKQKMKVEVKQDTSKPAPRPLDIYKVLEEATAKMQGINAICTAEAILQLWNWDSREDLLKARGAIDYLLKKLEET